MALGFLNRCGFRAASSGTGSFVVSSALTGMQTPAQAAGPAVVNSNTYRYFAESDDKTQWEYGYGVYTTGDVTLTRATILDNSSGGTTALSFTAAPKVFMGGPLAQDMAEDLVYDSGAIGSPVASVAFTPDIATYHTFAVHVRGLEVGATTLAPGLTLIDENNVSLLLVQDISTAGGTCSGCVELVTTPSDPGGVAGWQACASPEGTAVKDFIATQGSLSGAVTIAFFEDNGSGDPANIESGRVTVYARRRR